MDAKWRFGATVVIWALATLMSIVIIGNMSLGWIEDWVISIPLGVALFTTLAVWNSPALGSSNKSVSTPTTSEKKSDNAAYTMALLMEMMDEDEREEFKSQLKQRILSGESMTDASIIQEMEKRKRG